MINSLKIVNFQSLRLAKVELDKYTVLEGHSSSGKSALIRALRALLENIRGNSVISNGATKMSIQADTDDGSVILERTITSSSYKLEKDDNVRTFTKLGGEVPDEVSSLLGTTPSEVELSLGIDQFDSPYLLAASPAEIAKVLGSLTKVDVIHSAVREANKLKTNNNTQLKSKERDLESIELSLNKNKEVLKTSEFIDSVEEAYQEVLLLNSNISKYKLLIEAAIKAQKSFEVIVDVNDPPDLEELDLLLRQVDMLKQLIREVESSAVRDKQSQETYTKAEQNFEVAAKELADKMNELDVCPLCGQEMCNDK